MKELHLGHSMDIAIEQTVSGGKIIKYTNGILYFEPLSTTETLSLTEVKEHYEVFMSIQKGVPGMFLSDNRTMRKMGSQEKEFIRTTLPHFAHSAAMIVENGISKFMLNIFIHLNSPNIPIKGFSNKQHAIEWLFEQDIKIRK